ncbi:MAG TPA: hypothetical protein VGD99_14710 [Anaerolineae bacterium]|jgi:hypothetical protein
MMGELRIGVVGYSGQPFDHDRARQLLDEAYDQLESRYPDRAKVVVSVLTDVGIPALTYRAAVERGWRTAGIACAKAFEYERFPVDEEHIVGQKWGDESPTFLDSIDILVRVGGGKQALRETADMKASGRPVIEYDLANT